MCGTCQKGPFRGYFEQLWSQYSTNSYMLKFKSKSTKVRLIKYILPFLCFYLYKIQQFPNYISNCGRTVRNPQPNPFRFIRIKFNALTPHAMLHRPSVTRIACFQALKNPLHPKWLLCVGYRKLGQRLFWPNLLFEDSLQTQPTTGYYAPATYQTQFR